MIHMLSVIICLFIYLMYLVIHSFQLFQFHTHITIFMSYPTADTLEKCVAYQFGFALVIAHPVLWD